MLGAMGGVLGSLMALEAIREIVGGFGDGDAGLVGRLLMIDARSMRFETLTLRLGRGQSAERGRPRRGRAVAQSLTPPAHKPAGRVVAPQTSS